MLIQARAITSYPSVLFEADMLVRSFKFVSFGQDRVLLLHTCRCDESHLQYFSYLWQAVLTQSSVAAVCSDAQAS